MRVSASSSLARLLNNQPFWQSNEIHTLKSFKEHLSECDILCIVIPDRPQNAMQQAALAYAPITHGQLPLIRPLDTFLSRNMINVTEIGQLGTGGPVKISRSGVRNGQHRYETLATYEAEIIAHIDSQISRSRKRNRRVILISWGINFLAGWLSQRCPRLLGPPSDLNAFVAWADVEQFARAAMGPQSVLHPSILEARRSLQIDDDMSRSDTRLPTSTGNKAVQALQVLFHLGALTNLTSPQSL